MHYNFKDFTAIINMVSVGDIILSGSVLMYNC